MRRPPLTSYSKLNKRFRMTSLSSSKKEKKHIASALRFHYKIYRVIIKSFFDYKHLLHEN
jgi:hypothetical protein